MTDAGFVGTVGGSVEGTVGETPQATAVALATSSPAADTVRDAPPNPRLEAQRLLEESHQLLALALDACRGDTGSAGATRSSDLVGQASDQIGSALYFLRQLLRRS